MRLQGLYGQMPRAREIYLWERHLPLEKEFRELPSKLFASGTLMEWPGLCELKVIRGRAGCP